jgi:hypothetical protein
MAGRTPEQSSRGHTARQTALASYLEQIEGWRVEHPEPPLHQSTEIALGGGKLFLEGPEVGLIVQPTPPGACDLAEGFALLAKSADDLTQLMRVSNEGELYTAQAKLMLDYALGMALMGETQNRVEGFVAAGDVAQAKALSRLRHRLSYALYEVNREIADSERKRAETLFACLTDETDETDARRSHEVPASIAKARVGVDERPGLRDRRRRRRKAAAKRTGLTGTSFLAIALGGAAILWLGQFVVPRALNVEPPILDRSAFSGIAGVRSVEARPPSLFLQVDDNTWSELSETERRGVVQRVSRKLARHDYRGALIETTQGRPVAQWLADRGTSLLDSVEGSPPPSEQP